MYNQPVAPEKVDRPVVLHQGVYKQTATTAEAVFMITGMTIGAGILGIPYVVAKVGILIGLTYIVILGLIMLFLNIMISEVAGRTGENLQLPGLAGKYLGPRAKEILSISTVVSAVGALLAYIIGEGKALSALLGGNSDVWSVIFWSVGSGLILAGLHRVKVAEKILSALVIGCITFLSLYLLPHISVSNLTHFDPKNILLPYGVILFALHGTPAIAEARALLSNDRRRFRKAVIIGTLIPIAVYILFALSVVGASGLTTTEVASVGLGARFGGFVLILANVFAVFAMSTGFMGLGTALKEVLVWDHKLPKWLAQSLVIGIPILLFLAGFNNFVNILGIIGGVFIGLEAIIMIMVYWQARTTGLFARSRSGAHHMWFLSVPLLVVFMFITMHSIFKLLN